MKNFSVHKLIPALALLAVGCSTPTAMQSTEYDDMYYTSSDKTEFIEPEVTAQAEEIYESEEAVTNGGVINPEYSDERAVLDNYEGDEYYDGRSYDPRDSWYRPNYSYVDPYWASAYSPRYSSRYYAAVRDPFYDPFYNYDPFYYDSFYSPYHRPYWGSGVSVSIAFGSAWGNPYWANPYARPYYSNWYPHNNYYNGFNQGYQYGRNQYIYDNPGYFQARQIQRGPRDERSRIVTGDSRDGSGRPERGSLSSDNGQQAVMPGTNVNTRPSRTRGSRVGSENTKEVITTRPNVNRRTRTQRVSPATSEGQRQQVLPPVERTRRTRGEVSPVRETRQQPVRQETRPTERRERPVPVRQQVERRERSEPVRQQAPVRNYEQRSESRPAPVRSSSSSSSGSSSESRGGGRPTRGGN